MAKKRGGEGDVPEGGNLGDEEGGVWEPGSEDLGSIAGSAEDGAGDEFLTGDEMIGPMMDVGSATSTAPSSLTSGFKLAKQSAKGTPATTGFIVGRLVESAGAVVYDYTNQADEHFYSTNVRATANKSLPRRVSYVAQMGFRGYVHPEFVGMALLGMGYTATTTGASADKSHAFKLTSPSTAPWLTAVARVGDGSNILERRYTDMRLTSLGFDANAAGFVMAGSGYALKEEDLGASVATATTEPDAMILPSDGALTTLTINGEDLLSPIRGAQIRLINEVDTSELRLWQMERADLAISRQALVGVMGSIDVTEDVYQLLVYGAIGGSGPTVTCPSGALDFRFESPVVIPTTVVPYSIAFSLTQVEWRMTNITSRANGLIRFNLSFTAIDDGSATPWSITLVNAKTSY